MISIPQLSRSLVCLALSALPVMAQAAAQPAKLPPKPDKDSNPSRLALLDLGGLWKDNGWGNWLLLLLAIGVGVVAGRAAAAGIGKLANTFRRRDRETVAFLIGEAANPVSLLILAVGLHLGLSQMHLSAYLADFSVGLVRLLIYLAVFWYAYNLVEIVEHAWDHFAQKTDSKLIEQFSPMIRKTLRIFVVVVGALTVVSGVFRQDIGAWLAGLGIAGLAVSLAAQDTFKNFIGSVTILLDQPFVVGEVIRYNGYEGAVEEIGFRSTQVRTPNGHLVSIPNALIVNDPVENLARKPFVHRLMNVTIPCDTPREKVRQAVAIVRGLLDEAGLCEAVKPGIAGQPIAALLPKVHFNDINADSFNIRVEYRFMPADPLAYLEHAERFNLRLLEEFEKAGIELAFPSKTLYLAGDPKRALEVKVRSS